MTLADDYSHYTWLYFLWVKLEALPHFQEFHKMTGTATLKLKLISAVSARIEGENICLIFLILSLLNMGFIVKSL